MAKETETSERKLAARPEPANSEHQPVIDSIGSPSLPSITQSEQRKRQKRTLALTPEERLHRFAALQQTAESLLASNPLAWEAFHRRNRRQRTESRCRALELQLRNPPPKAKGP